ncbi:alpha-glucosidase [Aliidongia dinghuensis]|uniref:Alpha-glucosidase n=1 Tax=Aliidongia dinghuensis TaxID=1867774 RepID=A0A8J2YYA2_9PROT|nr:glycoside hydrolase family 31 protein [Aliidongia dinghuensis]GGF32427.1 alpha-glucosidase [Aliidongia dinghuensis]
MKPIRQAVLAETTERGVTLDCGDGIRCRISILKPDLVRVLFVRGAEPRQPRTWMVPAHGTADVPWEGRDRLDETSWPVPAFDRAQAADAITLKTAALTLRIGLQPLALTWSLPDGNVFARDRSNHAYLFGQKLRHHHERHEGDRYHGLGDKTGRLNLHGRRLRTTMLDSLGFDPEWGDPLYKHWPFVITRDGATGVNWGIFYDNLADATFDLGAEHDNYYGLFRGYEAADGDLDYYVFVGPDLDAVTGKFLDLTGRAPVPPRWTLGFSQTAMAIADSANAQARMHEFIEKCGAERIPVSAFHFGSGYTSIGPKRYVFTWNLSKYPEPRKLTDAFHAAGIKIVANLKPCLLDDHPAYRVALEAGAFIRDRATGQPVITQFWDGEGAHLDFTNQAGIRWWQDGVRNQVLDYGIDIAWNDNNEYTLWDDGPECAGFGTAIPLELARGLQPLLMTRASLEAQQERKPDERPFSVTRAGCPGIQRYAQTWSGDNSTSWRSLKWNLRTGLQMSLSGMHNIGHDVGGFSGPVPDAELLVRWTQMGSVHPRFIMNSWKPDGVYTAPWLHAEAIPAIRSAIRLRYRLLPYFYALMHQAAEGGPAPLRPTFAAFDRDPATFVDNDELMVGPHLLAAPVVEPGARSRAVYLPAGPECWFDFWSGERLPAGAEALLAAPLDRLPLVAPAGAIIPMTDEPADFSRLHDEPSRCLRLFPGPGTGSSRFTLYEDDGISVAGPVAKLRFELAWTPETVTLTADGPAPINATPAGMAPIGVSLPLADRRTLVLNGTGVALEPRPFRATLDA